MFEATVGALGLAVLVAATATAARAGDLADRALIGFSPDGAYFAFEEFGVQDGSGFPYSNIYLIDTAEDAWVAGTPIRLLREDEDVALEAVRAEARKAAAPLIAKYGIAASGRTVVSNPSSELSADPYKVRFLTDLYANWSDHAWTLTLTPLPFPERAPCENLGPVNGFRLVLVNPAGGTRALNEDKTIPASRSCPQDYAIADVITYFPAGDDPVMVVLIHLIRQGFEGPDRRFLAVATHFQDY
jgi:predicted secreted protein